MARRDQRRHLVVASLGLACLRLVADLLRHEEIIVASIGAAITADVHAGAVARRLPPRHHTARALPKSQIRGVLSAGEIIAAATARLGWHTRVLTNTHASGAITDRRSCSPISVITIVALRLLSLLSLKELSSLSLDGSLLVAQPL